MNSKPGYLQAVFNLPIKGSFTYEIPSKFRGSVCEGMRVLAPFGRRKITGYVVSLSDKPDPSFDPKKLKCIEDIPDVAPVISSELLKLTSWVADYYQSSWGEAIKATLPAGLDVESRKLFTRVARVVSSNREDIAGYLRRCPKQKIIYDLLLKQERKISELSRLTSSPSSALKQLCEKGLVEIVTVRIPTNHSAPACETLSQPVKLTSDQDRVYRKVCKAVEAEKYSAFLLHGVTGSGKTEIYIRCIQVALRLGRQAIMMVPEISLTPQMVSLFRNRFGGQVAILHSGLSNRQRFLEWGRIYEGGVSIAVGARSAIFAPFKNLGVIIIDEEHDSSYKQDTVPRYHARDTAVVRAHNLNAVVILGSATPSMESRRNAESGKYTYLSLPKRIHDRLLPVVKIVDMKTERLERNNFSILSVDLKNAIRHRLHQKEQIFLFLNRRGTANYMICGDCGYVFACPRCSVSLTFHDHEKSIRCHYCNFATRMPDACLECRGAVIRFRGFGTQKLEKEVQSLFPKARLLRLDRDTTRKHSDFVTMFDKMNRGEIDILIGTQMITKGHDFHNVTLVGVVHADLSLNIPDFRSGERSFQLLIQVAGRAGRGIVPGQVIVQTWHPRHYIYDFARQHDYGKFYEKELQVRKKLNYPPFTKLIGMGIESAHEDRGREFAKKMRAILVSEISKNKGIELLGPSPAALYKINEKFRWHLILRAREGRVLQSLVSHCPDIESLKKSAAGKVKLTIDVDPVNLL